MRSTFPNNVPSEGTAPVSLGVLGGGFGVSQDPTDHLVDDTLTTWDLNINGSLELANYIGGNQLAGIPDVHGDARPSGFCDTGCDQQSVAAAGGGGAGGIDRDRDRDRY